MNWKVWREVIVRNRDVDEVLVLADGNFKDGADWQAYTPQGERVSFRHTGLEYVVRADLIDAAVIGRGGKLKTALGAAGRALERRS